MSGSKEYLERILQESQSFVRDDAITQEYNSHQNANRVQEMDTQAYDVVPERKGSALYPDKSNRSFSESSQSSDQSPSHFKSYLFRQLDVASILKRR